MTLAAERHASDVFVGMDLDAGEASSGGADDGVPVGLLER